MTDVATLLASRPDTPQWLDLRGFLLSGRCEVRTNPDPRSGFVVRALDVPAAIAAGSPERAVVEQVLADAPAGETDWHLLAPPESVVSVSRALPGWRRRGVTLHTRPEGVGRSPAVAQRYTLRECPRGWAAAGLQVEHLPADLRAEYRTALVRSVPLVAAVAEDGLPVAFCYAAVCSESLWDVAVDTLESHRRLGLASACFETLATRLADRGLRPVWGALQCNTSSMRMAERLGFTAAAGLTSFVRPAP